MKQTGRPRSFDETDALTAAMRAFWAGGYAGTTYSDLESATGLRRQSLTYAFGEKPQLFRKALALYIDQYVAGAAAILERANPFRDNLTALFDRWEADATLDHGRGCLLVQSTAEFSNDDNIQAEIRRGDALLFRALSDAITRAHSGNEIPAHLEPAALARLIIATADGAMILAVTRKDPSVARTAHHTLLSLIF